MVSVVENLRKIFDDTTWMGNFRKTL